MQRPGRPGGSWRPRPVPLVASLVVALGAGGAAAGLTRLEVRGGGHLLLTTTEVWLLLVFVAGVLALLFGASARVGLGLRGQGAREGLERLRARAEALERNEVAAPEDLRGRPRAQVPPQAGGRSQAGEGGPGPEGIMATGGWLLLVYVAGWLVLG